MSVIFHHKRNYCFNKLGEVETFALGGETIAMEEIQPWLLECIDVGDFFEKKVGKAVCSEKDRYNKKLGRELSLKRMKVRKFTVLRIGFLNNKLIIDLSDDENFKYRLVKHNNCDSVFFIDYE